MQHKSCAVFVLAILLPLTAIAGQLPSNVRAAQRDTIPALDLFRRLHGVTVLDGGLYSARGVDSLPVMGPPGVPL